MKQCDNGHFYDEARFTSCPYCRERSFVGKTTAISSSIGKTVAVSSYDCGKTVAVSSGTIAEPATGFLICIDGPHRGADFKLFSGRNFIGRAAAMDVSLPSDERVSRESHALVTYDAKNNTFTLSPGLSRGITYLNGQQIEAVTQLKARDVIEVGDTRLMFIPVCGEDFKWDDC